ncbi:MAG: aminomethyl-transferring glycine dehydrogenase subunit GcvPA [Chloroflexota bacterium]|nr:aminomethyl-transferring glycine dehydrogenase subunit GcvPA [Chloroflexota bacterium]
MSYVPTTNPERRAMLDAIGVEQFDALVQAVPADLRFPHLRLPEALSEIEALRTLGALAERNADAVRYPTFLGAGAYNHFTPAAVHHTAFRGEFYTAYTPYQPEVSQGTLQVIYEFQTLMTQLYGMEVSNASMYDGATALAEAALMAISSTKRRRVVVADSVHPAYRKVMMTYMSGLDVELATVACVNSGTLTTTVADVRAALDDQTACLVVQYPSFVGTIDDLAALGEAAHAVGALFIVSSYPVALGMLKPPGAFGADVAVGEAQCFGTGLSFGGPFLGVLTCKQSLVRLMPGRVVGQTTDTTGRPGYVLTLQTREQHIRRERATSNICTNEGLNALMATIQMAMLGDGGVRELARQCYHKAQYLAGAIGALPGYAVLNADGTTQNGAGPATTFFNEFVVRTPIAPAALNARLLDAGMIGGYDLGTDYPTLAGHMLVCVTEMLDRGMLDRFVAMLASVG